MLDIALLPGEYAVCRLPAGTAVPAGLLGGAEGSGVVSVTSTADELSVICPAGRVPAEAVVETPWRCLQVVGPMDLALTGILASLAVPLADARVNIVAFSTYDTDYLLVPAVRLREALAALTDAGHRVAGGLGGAPGGTAG
ncbi:ACT domain-containing protein [Plantactinospora siamensis]|uniref:ACT domain-containing protein n=1 Tax=Plantactinospora siamensis TaxID=555372 RepID=A0ABV6NQJ1_9ACTN